MNLGNWRYQLGKFSGWGRGMFLWLGCIVATACAEDITYEFINYPELQGAYRMVGSITTDGTLGSLQVTNVKSINLELYKNAVLVERFQRGTRFSPTLPEGFFAFNVINATESKIQMQGANGTWGIYLNSEFLGLSGDKTANQYRLSFEDNRLFSCFFAGGHLNNQVGLPLLWNKSVFYPTSQPATVAGRVISDSFDGPTFNTNRWFFTNGVTAENAGFFQTNGALSFTWSKRLESVKWKTTLSTSSDWSVLARVSLNVLPGFLPGGPAGLWNSTPRQLAALLGAAAPTNSGDLPGAFLTGAVLDFHLDWRDFVGIVDDQKYLFVVNAFDTQIRGDHEFEFQPQAWLVLSYDSQRRTLRPMVAPVTGEDPPPFSSFVEAYPPVNNITESSLDIYLMMSNGDFDQSNTLKNYATGEILDFRILPVAVPEPPVISSPATASGALNGSFSYQITASGYPTSFSASGLPDGLSVDGATGLIFGTPTSASTNTVTVRATNEGGTGEKTVTITIRPVPVFAGPNYFRATIGRAFNHQLLINDSLSVRAANLPPGITLSTSGVLSGTPTTAGIFRPVLTATNTNGASTFQPNFVVQAASPTLPFTDPLATNTPGRYLKISGGTADLTFEAGRLNYSAPANPNGAGDANRVFFSPNVQLPLDSSWEVSVDVGLPRDRDAIDNAVGLALIPDQGTEDLSGLPANWISMELGQDFQSSQPFGGETSSSNLSFNFVYNADPNSFPWDSCNSQGIYGWKSDYFQPGAALFFNDALPWERFWDMVLTSIYLDDQILNPAVFCNAARVGTLVGVALTNTTDGPGFFPNGPYRTINNGGIIVASGKLRPGRFNLYTFFNYSGLIGRRAEGQIFRSTEITPEKISTLRLRYSSVSKTLVSDFNSAKASSWTNWAGIQTNSLDPAVADSLGQKFSLNGQSALRLGLWANARTPEAYPTNRIWFSNLVVRTLSGPALTALPASRTLTAGSALELNAPTGEGAFQYQWQKNRHDIEGATNATFTIESVTAADAGSYTVRVSDDVASTTSSPCALSVLDGPQLTLVYPGARSTYVSGLFGTNTVGFYDGYPDDEGNVERHGFLYNGSNWTQLRPTNSLRSEARGISSNRIVGTFTDSNERRRGYLLQNGVYTLLDYPGSTETRAFGVDGDRIVGDYRDTNSVRRAFLRTGTSWTNFSFPGAVSTSARGISGNRIVGNYTDLSGGAKGFILEGTNWTSLSHTNLIPSSEDPAQAWYATSISANGVSGNTVTGELNNGAGGTASFLYQGGAWQILNPSNLPAMTVYGIQGNRLGGFYLESPESGNWLGTVITLPAPEITTFEAISATMGDPFTLSVTADNAPAGFAATNLPPGLSLNPTNGMISGTPSWSGEYLAMISASNSAGVGSKNINFYVESQQLRIPSQGSFSKQLSAPGGAASFQVSGLPGGLALSSSGLISGTPANIGYYTATVRASNATGVFTSQIGFTVFRSNLVVTGRVVTPSNTPVANFPLRLVNPAFSGKIFASATTAANGTFQLTAPADRNYQIVQANLTNVNTLPTRFLYPVHVFNDWFGTPVDAGDIQAVAVDRTLQVRMVDAFSGEPITGTNLTRMGAAALSCKFFPWADPIAIWMLHQIQIRAQKSFWKLTAEERAGLREEASRLWTATRDNPSAGNADEVEIDWSFLEGYQTKELPPTYYANMQNNWNAQDNVVFYQEAEIFRYFAKTNSAGLYEVPVAVLGNDPRVNPWYMSDVAGPNPNCCMELAFDASEAVRGKVIARYEMVYEKGFFGQPGYRANNPLAVDLKVRPAPRMISGNFYRSNGTTPVTNGWVFLSQDIDHPSQDFLSTKCTVGAAGQFQFAVPEDSQDDWVITGEELSDTLTTAGGENWFTLARQFLQIRSSDVTGLKLVADQAPAIVTIQNGRAGETFRVTGSNLACLGRITLIPQASSEEEVVVQPVFQELWTGRRETGFVEFGVPDYLPPGSYKIQYQYPNFAANLIPFDLLSGGYDNEGFTTVTASNIFSISASTNTNGFSGRAGEVIRLPIRFGEKRMWNVTLSNNITGEARMLQPRSITPQYVELQLPQDAVLGEWSVVWGDALPITSLTLDDPSPVILLEPIDQAVLGGATANFAVGATGAQPLRYQWTQNGLNVDGATNSTLTITNARSIHAGEYAAVVSNWVGSVTSAVATLSVQQPPRILTQPRGTNLIAGQTYTLAVSAEGTEPMAYQWRKGGTNLEGANASSLLLDPVAGSDAGTYSVLVSNAVGSVLSSNTVLTVLSPPQFAVQATSGLRATLASAFRYDPIVAGSASVFSLSNTPAGLSVNRTNGSVTGTPTVPAYTRFAVVASNVAGIDTLALGLTVPAAPSVLPFLDEFTSVPPTNRYMKLNLGMPASLVWSNQAIRYVCATGDGDSAIAGWSPTLPLALTNSWEVSLDVQMPDGWETPSAAVGMSLFPDSPTMTFEQFNPHRLHFRLDRDTTSDIPGNRFYRCSYASGEEFPAVPYQTDPTSATLGRLRILYTTNTRTLHTLYREGTNNTAWVALGDPVNLNPSTSSSLAAAWGLSNTSGLRLIVSGNSTGTDGSARQAMTMDNLSVRGGAAPSISSQPGFNIIPEGGTASFSVTASGSDPYFYQWQKNGTNLAGATNSQLQRTNVQTVDAGNYSVVVSNLFGSITSSNARLTVVVTPSLPAPLSGGLRGNLGTAFSYAPIWSNSPTSFVVRNLPPGLSLNPATGVVSGTPTTAGYYRIVQTASNQAGTATFTIPVTVSSTALSLPLSDDFSAAVANRYMPYDFSELLDEPANYPQAGRLSFKATNGVLRLICPTNSPGYHSLGWVSRVTLPLSSPWEILLDVQMPNDFLTQEAQLGLTLFPAIQTSQTAETMQANLHELNFYLNRDNEFPGVPQEGSILERSAYAGGLERSNVSAWVPFQSSSNATLRIAYRPDQRILSTWGRANPGGVWTKVGDDVDFNPTNTNSLAKAWGLATNSVLNLGLTAYFEITNTNALPLIFADNLIARTGLAPTIAAQPVSTNVAIGGTASFSVTTSGPDPYFYQWRRNGTNLAGATNAQFQRTNAQVADAGAYSVAVSNLFGAVTSSNATLTVIAPPSFPTQASNGLRGDLGQAYLFQPNLSNAPAVFSATNLPPGLSIDRASGRITGTPTTSGYYRTTINASNIAGTASLPLNFTVMGARQTLPFSDNFSAATANRYLPFNYLSPGFMRITNGTARFDSPQDGTNGSTAGLVLNLPLSLASSWDVSADVNLPNGWVTPEVEIGMSLDPIFGPNDTVETILARGNELSLVLNRDTEIEGSNNVRRSVYVRGEDQDSLRTTITNDSLTNARLRFVYQTNSRSLRAWVQTNSATPWVAVGDALDMNPATGGSLAQRWGLSNGSSLFLTLTAFAEGGTGGKTITLDNLSMAVPVPPVITSTGNLIGQVGVGLAYTNRVTNGPAEFGVSNLPAGLSLHPVTGMITGTPTTAGLNNFIVTARTPAGIGIRTNTAILLPIFISTGSVTGFVNDAAFSHQVEPSSNNFGANLRFSASNLPTGTAINATSGVISGKPTVAGTYPATVTITALGASASQRIDFTFPAALGGQYSRTLNPKPTNVTGLPAGLSYNRTTGVISGTPLTAGNFTAVGQLVGGGSTNISISVLPSVPVISSPTNIAAKLGQEFFYQIVPGGFGREWAGFDNFEATSSTNWTTSTNQGNATLIRPGGATGRLVFRPGTTSNVTQRSYQYWNRAVPAYSSWLAFVDAFSVPTNPSGGLQMGLAAVQIEGRTISPKASPPQIRHVFWNKIDRSDSTAYQWSQSLVGGLPWGDDFAGRTDVTAYDNNGLGFADSYALYGSGLSILNSRAVYRNSSPGSFGLLPPICLSVNRSWTATVQVKMSNNWPIRYAGLILGVMKAPQPVSPKVANLNTNQLLAAITNRFETKIGRNNSDGNYFGYHGYAVGGYNDDGPNQITSSTVGLLKLTYNATNRTLRSAYSTDISLDSPSFSVEGETLKVENLDWNNPGSLGARWGLNSNSCFWFFLSGSTEGTGNGNNPDRMAMTFFTVYPDGEQSPLVQGIDQGVCAIGYDAQARDITAFRWDTEAGDLVEMGKTSTADWQIGTNSSFAMLIGGLGSGSGRVTNDGSLDNFVLMPWKENFTFGLEGALPAGLIFDSTTGSISGQPTSPGTYNIFTTVQGDGGRARQPVRIIVGN